MMEMPPGTGKSVVIALLVGLVHGVYKHIKILYNDVALAEFERPIIQ